MKNYLYLLLALGLLFACDDDTDEDKEVIIDIDGHYYRMDKADSEQANILYDSLDGKNWNFKAGWPLEGGRIFKLSNILNIYGINTVNIDTVKTKDSTIFTVKIRAIKMPYNNIEGEFPDFMMDRLDSIDFNNNDFSGNIPDLDMPSLKFLNLSHNKFSGEIPNFSSNVLEHIDINYNFLTGEIPALNMPNLKSLDVSFNKLDGGFDQLSLSSLEKFVASANNYGGVIPSFNFPKLTTLRMHSNTFTGDLPSFSGNSKLEILDFANNMLDGSIPADLPNSLTHLNLADNMLSGNIPTFRTLVADTNDKTGKTLIKNTDFYLYLAYNNFTFADLEGNAKTIKNISYEAQNYTLVLDESIADALSAKMDGEANVYNWYVSSTLSAKDSLASIGTTTGSYYCIVKNTLLPKLSFKSNTVTR